MDDATQRERTDRAESLFRSLGEHPSIPLGVLTDDQEMALGQQAWGLGDAAVLHAWLALPEGERRRRAQAAVAALVRAGQAVVGAAGPRGVPEGAVLGVELSLVDLARRQGGLVLSTSLRRADDGSDIPPVVRPLAYAVIDEVGGLRGLVVELRGGARHDYRLTSLGRTAGGLATWAVEAVHPRTGPQVEAVVTLVGHRRPRGGLLTQVVLSGASSADSLIARVERADSAAAAAQPVTAHTLAAVLADEIAAAAELAGR